MRITKTGCQQTCPTVDEPLNEAEKSLHMQTPPTSCFDQEMVDRIGFIHRNESNKQNEKKKERKKENNTE